MRYVMCAAVCAFVLLGGCRREDVRDFTLTIPELSSDNRAKIVEALAKYNGVRKDSYRWDMGAKTLTLRYDSMQIAKENIRQAIEGANVKIER